MPHLLLVLLAGAGVWAGYSWYRKEQARVRDALGQAEEELRRRDENAIPTLKRDPDTGIFEPPDK
jgi:hypothetical protein